jgi:RNA polymerase sigma-54 factor
MSGFTGQPDAVVSRPAGGQEGPLRIEVFTPVNGWLRVDPAFKAALAGCNDNEREAWERYAARAQLFAKCLRQRNNTMCRLMEVIVREQEPYILGGDRDLKPMTRAALATHLGVHESTISRAVAHKTVALPDGRIVPLAKFFDRSLSVRDALKEIVGRETQPLTDDEIAGRLAGLGYKVARRTVAKYRAAEGILPAIARSRAAMATRAVQ